MFEVFGDFNPASTPAEVEERWGDTDAFRRVGPAHVEYTKADWKRIQGGAGAWSVRVVEAMNAGRAADSPEAMDAAEAHRQQISDAYYDCTYEIHLGLGEMYVADPRFAATYEKVATGLASYLRDAIRANAARHAG